MAGFDKSYLGAPAGARDFVRLARRPGRVSDAAGGIMRRLLLIGPTGAGKKTLARALAAELGCHFAALGRRHSCEPDSLAIALSALDTQARTSEVGMALVYFEAGESPMWADSPQVAAAAYAERVQLWAAGAYRHLCLVVGALDERRLEPSLADAVGLQCRLAPPDAPTRSALWARFLADMRPLGVRLAPELEVGEALDKILVRPSSGLFAGDIARALQYALRAAAVQHPDACSVTLDAGHLREGIRHRQDRRMEMFIGGIGSLVI